MTEPTTGERIVMNTLEYDAKTLRTSPRCGSLRALAAAIDEAVKAEREACVEVADQHAKRDFPWGSENSGTYHAQANWAERISKAIRARGQA